MISAGIVGWRGMVGSVLMDRMKVENDFAGMDPVFFSTTQTGNTGPDIGSGPQPVNDANQLKKLAELDIILSCQGSGYTEKTHTALRQMGWEGYWIDAASTLRMKDSSVIVLDPVNRDVIDRAFEAGIKDYIGGNCTVSLMFPVQGPRRQLAAGKDWEAARSLNTALMPPLAEVSCFSKLTAIWRKTARLAGA